MPLLLSLKDLSRLFLNLANEASFLPLSQLVGFDYKSLFDRILKAQNEEELNYLLSWSKGVLDFYKYALKNQLNTIFTVDL